MTTSAADGADGSDLAGDVLYQLEVLELARPHIVLTRDSRSGRLSFAGPYPSAVEALCAAETEYQVDRDGGGLGEVTFHVAALYPPLGGTPGGLPAAASTVAHACRRGVRHGLAVARLATTFAARWLPAARSTTAVAGHRGRDR